MISGYSPGWIFCCGYESASCQVIGFSEHSSRALMDCRKSGVFKEICFYAGNR